MTRFQIICILAFAFLGRSLILVFSWDNIRSIQSSSDEAEYLRLSRTISQDHGLFDTIPDGPTVITETGFPNTARMPLYPWFIAVTAATFGSRIYAPIIVQNLLALGLLWAVFRFYPYTRRQGSVLAVLFLLFDPVTVSLPFYHLTETVFTVLIFTSMVLFLRGNMAWAGLVMGFAALTRANPVYLPPCLLCAYLLLDHRRILNGFYFSLAFLPPVGFWFARNYIIFGSVFFTTLGWYSLYSNNAAYTEASVTGRTWHEVRVQYEDKYIAGVPSDTPAAAIKFWQSESIQTFVNYPMATLSMAAKGVGQVLAVPGSIYLLDLFGLDQSGFGFFGGTPENQQRISLLRIFDVVFLACLYLGVFVKCINRMDRTTAILMFLSLYIIFTFAGPHATARYRMSVMPFLAAISAEGWLLIYQKLHQLAIGGHKWMG